VDYPDEEVRDSGEIIAWLSAQSWSNGRVATDGISYTGNTAELAAVPNHPALKAATPRFTDFDNYTQIHFPGGLQSRLYLANWGTFVKALDRNDVETLHSIPNMASYRRWLGIKPVDEDVDGMLLKAAIDDHKHNVYFVDHGRDWLFRDDLCGITPNGERIDRRPLFTYGREIERAQIPMMHWAGWLDSGTADGALARFASFDAPNVTVIGPCR
jgi:putative CocE/NonD family hydrolase